MPEINYGWLDQYGTEPLERQQFGTASVEGVNRNKKEKQRVKGDTCYATCVSLKETDDGRWRRNDLTD